MSKLQNVFVQIPKCICPNCKMYFSKLLLQQVVCPRKEESEEGASCEVVVRLRAFVYFSSSSSACPTSVSTSRILLLNFCCILLYLTNTICSKFKINLSKFCYLASLAFAHFLSSWQESCSGQSTSVSMLQYLETSSQSRTNRNGTEGDLDFYNSFLVRNHQLVFETLFQ